MKTKERSIILYDASCGFCHQWILRLKKHDRSNSFLYIPLQEAAELLVKYGLRPGYDESVVLIEDGRARIGSEAMIGILHRIPGYHLFGKLLHKLPASIGRRIYRLIAANRFLINGSRSSCRNHS
jgi:predicted DCC family thiol-disulfide oxidoreductase YuxK